MEDREGEEGYPPPHTHRSYREAPYQTSPSRDRGEADRAEARPAGPDAYRGRDEPTDRSPSPVDRSSPRFRDPSPARKGAGGHHGYYGRPANGYEREAAYTNNTNEDSGVAGLSPEDQYKHRDKENYYDALNRWVVRPSGV